MCVLVGKGERRVDSCGRRRGRGCGRRGTSGRRTLHALICSRGTGWSEKDLTLSTALSAASLTSGASDEEAKNPRTPSDFLASWASWR